MYSRNPDYPFPKLSISACPDRFEKKSSSIGLFARTKDNCNVIGTSKREKLFIFVIDN